MKILLISDIHANYPALQAIGNYFNTTFDLILNGGDTTVYAPFPNETINWLRQNKAVSILGNTDRHIITLLNGKTFKKPRKAEKRIMYGWTAAELSTKNRDWLLTQPLSRSIDFVSGNTSSKQNSGIGMFHGSPDDPDEFLFRHTSDNRFHELARTSIKQIITVGHSHSPFHKKIGGIHFINPGSVGRMFDGNPKASCAVLTITDTDQINVRHFRIAYPVEQVVDKLRDQRLPRIYGEMYRKGKKLN